MKGSRIHLDLFKVFSDLARTGGFSTAAELNHITQSAVSQQLFYLERLVGRRLVDRKRRALALTPEGQAFLEGSKTILEAYQQTLDRIQSKPDEVSGRLKVETIYSIGLHELTHAVRTFLKAHPRVRLDVEYKHAGEIYRDVLEGRCDLGLVACPKRHALIDVAIFGKERMAVVCFPGHPLSRKRVVSLREIAGKDFVAFQRSIPTRELVDRILRDRRVPVNIVHELDNIEMIKGCVEAQAGLSILPENTIRRELKDGTLIGLSIREGPFFRPIAAIKDKRRASSKAASEFLQWLSEKRGNH